MNNVNFEVVPYLSKNNKKCYRLILHFENGYSYTVPYLNDEQVFCLKEYINE